MVFDDVWATLQPDPEVVELERQRAVLKGGDYRVKGMPHEDEVRRLTRSISSAKARWKKMVIAVYRAYYFKHRPTWDLERQANGEAAVVDDDGDQPRRELQLADRANLARLLCDQPDDLHPRELRQRRIDVGSCMVNLGQLRERIRPERWGGRLPQHLGRRHSH